VETTEASGTLSLWAALSAVPDHRRAEGKRYPLASLLLMAIAAMLAGRREQLSIVRWGRRLSLETLAALGIGRPRVPAPSGWCELFCDLNVVALERVLGAWVRGGAPAGHVAIDGKRLRGSATATSPGIHLLAAFSTGLEGVIGQLRVDPEANEITAALEMLKTLPLQGTIVTGDAIFTQKAICRAIVDGGGDYFFTVKANQPALKADIEQAFRPFSPSMPRTPRLTWDRRKPSRKVMAGSKPAGLRRPPRCAICWHRSGRGRRRSAASRGNASCAAERLSRPCVRSPA
jgi:hypothetical protein